MDLPFACDSGLVVVSEDPSRSGVTYGDVFFFGDGLIGVVTFEMATSTFPFKDVDGTSLFSAKYLDVLFREADLVDRCSSNLWINTAFTPDTGKLRTFNCDLSSGMVISFQETWSAGESDAPMYDLVEGGML
jgi:hypothetical protein